CATEARRLVDDQWERRIRVELHALMADPDHAVAAHQPPKLVARFLLDKHQVELTGGQSAQERTALVDGEFEVDLRVELAKVTQHLGQLRERKIIRRAEAKPTAHGRPGEVAGRL